MNITQHHNYRTHLLIIAGIIVCSSGSLFSMEDSSRNGIEVLFANDKKTILSYKQLADLSRISMTIRYLLKDFDAEKKPELHLTSLEQEAFHIIMENKSRLDQPCAEYQLNNEFNNNNLYGMPTLTNIIVAAEYLDIELIKKAAQSSLTSMIRRTHDSNQKNTLLESLEKYITVLHPKQQEEILSAVINKEEEKLLYHACTKGLLTLARLLVAHIKRTLNNPIPNYTTIILEEGLKESVVAKQAHIAYMLLNNKVNPNAYQALNHAIKNHDLAMVKLLLENGANPNDQSGKYRPLSFAYFTGAPGEIIQLLKTYKATASPTCLINYIQEEDTSFILFTKLMNETNISVDVCKDIISRVLDIYGSQEWRGLKKEINDEYVCFLVNRIAQLNRSATDINLAKKLIGIALYYNKPSWINKAFLLGARAQTLNTYDIKINFLFGSIIVRGFFNDTTIRFLRALECAIYCKKFDLIEPILAHGGCVRKEYLWVWTDTINNYNDYPRWDKQKKNELIKKITQTALP